MTQISTVIACNKKGLGCEDIDDALEYLFVAEEKAWDEGMVDKPEDGPKLRAYFSRSSQTRMHSVEIMHIPGPVIKNHDKRFLLGKVDENVLLKMAQFFTKHETPNFSIVAIPSLRHLDDVFSRADLFEVLNYYKKIDEVYINGVEKPCSLLESFVLIMDRDGYNQSINHEEVYVCVIEDRPFLFRR